jgi:hypothetical protein
MLTATPSGGALTVLSAFAALSFSLSAYYFGFFDSGGLVRSLAILAVIWGFAAWTVYRMWPSTFTVYKEAVIFAGKDHASLLWLVNGPEICPSHVAIYLFIRNNESLAARITDLSIEASVNGVWINLPIMDTRNM